MDYLAPPTIYIHPFMSNILFFTLHCIFLIKALVHCMYHVIIIQGQWYSLFAVELLETEDINTGFVIS